MTRKELTGTRNLNFSGWIREKLPDSATGFSVSDLDFILWNWKHKKVMFLEIKTRNSRPRPNQKEMWRNLNRWVSKGIDEDWSYLGFHLITFEKTFFDDGKCFLNYNEINEENLIKFLSL
jgi:hypothetical protein